MCGFSDPLYFSRLFKKKYGVSPRNYAPEPAYPAPAGPDTVKIMV
jgi:AraC-like DNA-binding protein